MKDSFRANFLDCVIGGGGGRGIALIFIVAAISLWVSSSYAFANPCIRNLEEEIPDEMEEIDEVAGGGEKQPAMQTSS